MATRLPPLARLLHKHLKVGEPIPAPLFEVVAKVLAWAYELKQATAADELPLPEIGVNGCLIAQGEVVIVDDRYGIRLTDIISPSERLRKSKN